MKTNLTILLIAILFANSSSGQGLDLAELLNIKGKFYKLSGGVSSQFSFNTSNDIHYTRQPMTAMLSGNLNLQLMSWSIPVNFAYTNQKLSYGYNNPFKINRTAIHPKYKGITIHAGDINMSLSPYTMNGLMFTGGGFELAPKKSKIKLTAFYGRFLKETQLTPEFKNANYARWGWGIKTDINQKKHKLSLSLFHAIDQYKNALVPLDALQVFPQENLCYTFNSQSHLSKSLDVDLDYSGSIITRDTRSDGPSGTSNPFAVFIKHNTTTTSFTAFKTNIHYNTPKRKISFGFEHIDPNYKTLGALYFNNDIENFTISISQGFLKKKLMLSITSGLQRDNLNNQKLRTSQRWVGSANASLQITKKINTAFNYSSFQSYSTMRSQFERINQPNTPYMQLDTLQYIQLSQQANMNCVIQLKQSKKRVEMLSISGSWQKASDNEIGIVKKSSGNQIFNGNLAYIYQLPESGIGLNGSLSYTYIHMSTLEQYSLGPVIAITHKHKKTGLNQTINFIWNQTYKAQKSQGENYMLRYSSSYTYKKKHQMGMSLSYQNRNMLSVKGMVNNYTFLSNITYNYTF